MASIQSSNNDDPQGGTDIMIAGLAFQVITLFIFISAAVDFAIRTYRRQRAMGEAAFDQDPTLVALRATRKFKVFLGALSLATILILWRSAFRVAELSEGWSGPIMGDQYMFVGFEGVLIIVAVFLLNVCHPAVCIGPLFDGAGGLNGLWCLGRKKNKHGRNASDVELKSSSPGTASV